MQCVCRFGGKNFRAALQKNCRRFRLRRGRGKPALRPVERAVVDCLQKLVRLDCLGCLQVGDCAGDFQNSVPRARRQPQLLHCGGEYCGLVVVEPAEFRDLRSRRAALQIIFSEKPKKGNPPDTQIRGIFCAFCVRIFFVFCRALRNPFILGQFGIKIFSKKVLDFRGRGGGKLS